MRQETFKPNQDIVVYITGKVVRNHGADPLYPNYDLYELVDKDGKKFYSSSMRMKIAGGNNE